MNTPRYGNTIMNSAQAALPQPLMSLSSITPRPPSRERDDVLAGEVGGLREVL
jgi:hypothetical protein